MANPEPHAPHLVVCQNAAAPTAWSRGVKRPIRLVLGTGDRHVHLRMAGVTRALQATLPPVAHDLVEIATFVYVADQAVSRGGTKEFEYGARWRRRFRMVVPVRVPDLWSQGPVRSALADALAFMTDDDGYEFHFTPARPVASERRLFDEVAADPAIEEVCLFSGGLDSLCGAVQEITGCRRVALVGHRSCGQTAARQTALVSELVARSQSFRAGIAPLMVALTANKGKRLTREVSQRSRSFLFASAAAAVATASGLRRVRFFENGVTGLNLPVSPQLIGSRASRTTHPQTLAKFQHLFRLLFGPNFQVDNPFADRTKAELLAALKAAGFSDLAARTSSCAHTITRKSGTTHCGTCSQCVDRRVSVLAAGLTDKEDPPANYAVDPFTGHRDGPDRIFAERYAAVANEMPAIRDADAFAERFPEVHDATAYLGGGRAAAGLEAAFHLLSRHNAGVRNALQIAFARHGEDLIDRRVPASSLLGAVVQRPAAADVRVNGPASGRGMERGLVIDTGRYEVRFDGVPCPLGNTHEFHFLVRLHRARGNHVPYTALGADVWDNPLTPKSSIHRVVSNIRRKLGESGIQRLVIECERGSYALVVCEQDAKSA